LLQHRPPWSEGIRLFISLFVQVIGCLRRVDQSPGTFLRPIIHRILYQIFGLMI
jgi:hypothetical protein